MLAVRETNMNRLRDHTLITSRLFQPVKLDYETPYQRATGLTVNPHQTAALYDGYEQDR